MKEIININLKEVGGVVIKCQFFHVGLNVDIQNFDTLFNELVLN